MQRRQSGAHLKTSTELTVRIERVEVVAADKFLRETDDGHVETHVTVVVRRVLCDVSRELSDLDHASASPTSMGAGRADLDLRLELALEAREEHLALSGLEAIDDRGNGSDVVRHREEDELLVDEVCEGHLRHVVVHERAGLSRSARGPKQSD